MVAIPGSRKGRKGGRREGRKEVMVAIRGLQRKKGRN